jgi:mannose-6-phosphate isomerase-like protein (cupin superfamily)
MKLLAAVPAVFIATTLFAGDPNGFGIWKADELKASINAAKLDEHKASSYRLGVWGDQSIMLLHREGDAESEVHETRVHIITVIAGEGTLVLGGTIVGGHATRSGEIRGTGLTGGTEYKMMPRDVIRVPANVPHRMLVPKSLTVEMVNIETK